MQAGLNGTDWVAVGGMTGVMALVVAVVTAIVNAHAEKRRRNEDGKERILFRRLDRAERKRLLQAELSASRRERLARNYGLWYRSLTATVLAKERQVLAQEAANKHEPLAQKREKQLVEQMKTLHPSLHAQVFAQLAQLNRDAADYQDEAADGHLKFINGVTELAAVAMLIQIDESAEISSEVEMLTVAVSEPYRLDIKEAKQLIHQAGVHIEKRITALRAESESQR